MAAQNGPPLLFFIHKYLLLGSGVIVLQSIQGFAYL